MGEVKTVTFRFEEAVSVKVKGEKGLSENQILSIAKKQVIDRLKRKFPSFSYNITEGESIDLEKAYPGLPVRSKDSGELGIITSIKASNKLQVNFTLTSGESLRGLPAALGPVHKGTKLDKFVRKREHWRQGLTEGDTGYLVAKDEIIPIVFSKPTKTFSIAFPISHDPDGSYFKLSQHHLTFVFSTRKEAEAFKSR